MPACWHLLHYEAVERRRPFHRTRRVVGRWRNGAPESRHCPPGRPGGDPGRPYRPGGRWGQGHPVRANRPVRRRLRHRSADGNGIRLRRQPGLAAGRLPRGSSGRLDRRAGDSPRERRRRRVRRHVRRNHFPGRGRGCGPGRMAHRRKCGVRTGGPGGEGRTRHAGINPGHKRVRASRRKAAGRFRQVAPVRVPAVAGGERPGMVELSCGPDQAGRGVSQPGAGRPGAQRPATGLRRAVARAAGRGRASPGRRPEHPARPSTGHGPGVDLPRRLAPGVLTRGRAGIQSE